MATIYPSGLINRIKGRVGSNVYKLIYGTNFAVEWPATISHPITYRTTQIKANISAISKVWNDLSPEKKRLWQSRATKVKHANVGFHEFMSLNSTLLHASHADLVMITHPPSTPATPRAVRNFCFFQVNTYSMCLFWSKPLNTTDYVEAYFRLHRNFCSLNPCFGLCTSVGYRPCWRFVSTVRSDQGYIEHNFDWPPGTRLYYRAYSIDKFGRHSPMTFVQQTFTENLDYFYVVDTDNSRIVKRLISDLSYISKIGSLGSGNDQFNSPQGVAIDATHIFIADSFNNRIVKRLKSDFSYVSKIGSQGSGNDQFNRPADISVDATHIFIADSLNNRIVKRLKSDLSYVSKIGTVGSGNDQFDYPVGISVDTTHIFIADSNNSRIVKRLKSDLSYVSKIGTEGSDNDQFLLPFGISVDTTHIFIADSASSRIVKRLKSDLSYVSKIGTEGSGDNQFNFPDGISVDATHIFIADTGNHRIVKRLKSDLSYVSQIGSLGSGDNQFNFPRSCSTDYSYFFSLN